MSHGLLPSGSMFRARRWFLLNLLAATIIAFGFIAQTAISTSASIGWCRSDPVLLIDLAVADVFVSAEWDDLTKVTGATEVVVVIPSTVKTAIGIPTLGFGYGERVDFEWSHQLKQSWSKIELIIKVLVPSSDSSMPIRVEFSPRVLGVLAPTTAYGTANNWVTFRAVL